MQKLDDVDRKILDILIDNTRTPFTDIAKRLLISAGTVHVRVKKMEDLAIIKGSSLTLDYKMLGYNFIAYVGILIDRSEEHMKLLRNLKRNLTSLWLILQQENIIFSVRLEQKELNTLGILYFQLMMLRVF